MRAFIPVHVNELTTHPSSFPDFCFAPMAHGGGKKRGGAAGRSIDDFMLQKTKRGEEDCDEDDPTKKGKSLHGAAEAGDWREASGESESWDKGQLVKLRAILQDAVPWSDAEFPPERKSIEGPQEPTTNQTRPGAVPHCRCNKLAKTSIVQKDTPNKGRPYYHCEERRCGFFAWADNRRSSIRDYTWKRFPSFVLVTDFGFSAQDLQQGGIGDCWFLSALAVVAERHDLIAKLFYDTAPNASGCYMIRLFLDGSWQTILVDDQLPCTRSPRRPEHALETNLAFSRGQNCQLWVSLLEKAYAKAHGS